MTTKKQLRQVFTQHWSTPCSPPGKTAWLIKGDFDRFKLTNDLYGSLICDYLLDWTLEVIEAELRSYENHWQGDGLLWNFTGDDITIYVPPSTLQDADIAQLLWGIRHAIVTNFFRRYKVGMIPLPGAFFEGLPAAALEMIRQELEKMDVVLDFARRQKGYLALFPVGLDGIQGQIMDGVRQVIQKRTGRLIAPQEVQMEWICDPDETLCRSFNQGYLDAPSVSFAACSISMGVDDRSVPYDRRLVYERVSLACQTALRRCKQERKRVLLQPYELLVRDIYACPQPAGGWALQSPLRWASERYLRESLYFKAFERPVLFQFNPVYCSSSSKFAPVMAEESLRIEKYRGNKYGVGLKGINEIFGQASADCLIVELMSVVSKVMHNFLVEKGIPPASIHIARFVDRFTVFCEEPAFHTPQVVRLVSQVAALFNAVSDDIKISHLRTSVVTGGRDAMGYSLFRDLTLTSLSSHSTMIEGSSPPVELRQNHPASTLTDGARTFERNSFLGAKMLDVLNTHSLQRP
jgi:GGDEF domain-containing protein